MDRIKILDHVKRLSEAQFGELVFRAGIKPSDLPGSASPQTLTAIELIQWHEARPGGLSDLVTHLEAVLGSPVRHLVGGDPLPSPPTSAPAPRLIQEGQPWVCPETGIEFLWVPPGEFWMGSIAQAPPEGSPPEVARRHHHDANRLEHPGALVPLPRGHWIAKHPVTLGDYALFLAERGSVWPKVRPPLWDEPKAASEPTRPVTRVDWFDALLFCHWLTDKLAAQLSAGHRILLPTEAQWERAARGADARAYPWGDKPPTKRHAVFERPLHSATLGQPALVGERPAGASPVGCHDMAGNVFEWCLTESCDDLRSLHSPERDHNPPCGLSDALWALVNDPQRLAEKPARDERVLCATARGGAWYSHRLGLRCAFRTKLPPELQDHGVGFRVCCVV
jgi:formylglycine-generating enzyme required for sulfatase activity